MKIPLLSLLAAAAALAGCAEYYPPPPPPPPPPMALGTSLAPGDCFRTADIRNHTVADPYTLYLQVQGKGAYRVAMAGGCLAAHDSNDVLVMRQPPGSTIVCSPIDLDISMARTGVRTGCIPTAISRMSLAEVEALPPRLRP